MPITINDIAQITGLNKSTISRALNDNPRISKQTIEKVKKVANDLGFEKNNNARSLSTSKTGNIALIYESSFDNNGSRAYIDQLFLNLRHELNKKDLDTIICEATNFLNNSSNSIRLIKQRKIDGLLFLHDSISREDREYAKKMNIPAINIHIKPENNSNIDYFVTDNIHGGYLAGQHLYEKGCKKILIISCSSNVGREHTERTEGCKKAFIEKGIEISQACILSLNTNFYSGYQFAINNYEFISKFDGIFAQADVIAAGIIAGLKTVNISVPNDIKIIGYDDCLYSTLFNPFITTIHQPKEEITKKVIERLTQLLKENKQNNNEFIHSQIKPTLVLREST